jgi:hypothetical protein
MSAVKLPRNSHADVGGMDMVRGRGTIQRAAPFAPWVQCNSYLTPWVQNSYSAPGPIQRAAPFARSASAHHIHPAHVCMRVAR